MKKSKKVIVVISIVIGIIAIALICLTYMVKSRNFIEDVFGLDVREYSEVDIKNDMNIISSGGILEVQLTCTEYQKNQLINDINASRFKENKKTNDEGFKPKKIICNILGIDESEYDDNSLYSFSGKSKRKVYIWRTKHNASGNIYLHQLGDGSYRVLLRYVE